MSFRCTCCEKHGRGRDTVSLAGTHIPSESVIPYSISVTASETGKGLDAVIFSGRIHFIIRKTDYIEKKDENHGNA